MAKKNHPATAYSYLRFSSVEQAKGDSLRRQSELRDAWLKKSGARLDTSITLRDEGVSAFTGGHRENADRHALAGFLELVKAGRIQRGSYLVVESLDRLSREHIQPALRLMLDLTASGIRIVQLLPVEQVFDDQSDVLPMMMAMMELSRGNSESRVKSERVGAAWKQKRLDAAKSGKVLSSRCPYWLQVVDGKFVIDERKAEVIRRIFKLAIEGQGMNGIANELIRDGVKPIGGKAEHWSRSTLWRTLSNPAVIGTYQPQTGRGGKRRPDGKPIPNYFPPIIEPDTYHAALAALKTRQNMRGRRSVRVNIFAGLLVDAISGARMHVQNFPGSPGAVRMCLTPFKEALSEDKPRSRRFPADVFESAILHELAEIDPREILPQTGKPDKVLALTGKLADVEGRIEKLKAKLIDGDGEVSAVVDVLRELEKKRTSISAELMEAKQAAASPLAESWGSLPNLTAALETAPDKDAARVRLRSVLRRVVESIHVVICGRGIYKAAAVRVQFRDTDRHRDYLIRLRRVHAASGRTRLGRVEVSSFAHAGGLDLRNPKAATLIANDLHGLLADPDFLP